MDLAQVVYCDESLKGLHPSWVHRNLAMNKRHSDYLRGIHPLLIQRRWCIAMNKCCSESLRGLQPSGIQCGWCIVVYIHGAGTHSIEGKKWQENAEHIAQDIWGCSAFMLSKWDSYCRVDLGSPNQNFFRAPPARSAGKPMERSYRYRLRFGTRSRCQNFRASFQGFSKTSKQRTEAYRMHVGTDFLKLPPVTGQYWSLFQCSMLGTGGTCEVLQ